MSPMCWRKNEMKIWRLEGKTESGTCHMRTDLIYYFLERRDFICCFPFQFDWCI